MLIFTLSLTQHWLEALLFTYQINQFQLFSLSSLSLFYAFLFKHFYLFACLSLSIKRAPSSVCISSLKVRRICSLAMLSNAYIKMLLNLAFMSFIFKRRRVTGTAELSGGSLKWICQAIFRCVCWESAEWHDLIHSAMLSQKCGGRDILRGAERH